MKKLQMRSARANRLQLFGLILGAVVAAGLMISPTFAQESQPPETRGNDLSVEAIKEIVRDTILENPEIIGEALDILKKKKREARAEQIRQTIAERSDELFNDPDSPVGGNPEGDVTVVEFFDYNCPYCRRVAPTIAQILEQDSNVRIVYKEYPILGSVSVLAAQAALAAKSQGKYPVFHAALMASKGVRDLDQIMKIAESVGLDIERLWQDMNDPAIIDAIDRNKALARALGTRTTPSFVIGNRLARGAKSLQSLRRLIALARSQAQ